MAKASKSKVTTSKGKVTTKAKSPVAAKKQPVKTKAQPAKSIPVKKPVAKAVPVKKPAVKSAPVKVAAKATPVKKPIVKSAPATNVKATVKGKTTVQVMAQKKPVVAAKEPAKEIVVAAPVVAKKPEKLDFTAGDFVVYPAHGVGQVEGVETLMISGLEVTLYTICFEKDRMRLKLPVSKVKASGLRKLSSKDRLKDALATLQGRSQVRRIMWSRRAQEYEAKINSGDPVSIAEVLRDLKKEGEQDEQSYSERQIYQAALARLAREVAAIENIDEKKASEKLEAVLGYVA
jgi:CarD family transcriptional regulator